MSLLAWLISFSAASFTYNSTLVKCIYHLMTFNDHNVRVHYSDNNDIKPANRCFSA